MRADVNISRIYICSYFCFISETEPDTLGLFCILPTARADQGLSSISDMRRQSQQQQQQPMPKLFSFNTGFIFSIERETGIEPATPSLARRCSTTEPLAHNTNIKFAVAYKLAPTNISISDFNFCVNLFLQISCNFSATFVTNAPPIIKSAFAFIIKNHQKTDRRANPVK